jgi:hypothetical protein
MKVWRVWEGLGSLGRFRGLEFRIFGFLKIVSKIISQ